MAASDWQEDFPIISLIDEPSSHLVANYYDSVLQNIGSGGPVNNNINSINTNNNNNNDNNDNSFISSPTLAPASSPNFRNSFAASSFNPNPNNFGAASQGAAGLNSLSNPYYAPEEFTYNQVQSLKPRSTLRLPSSFQPGEGPCSRGLLRDYKPSCRPLFQALQPGPHPDRSLG